MERFFDHPFVPELLSLGLPGDDFAIAGSGPLFVRGLIDALGDLDVVARGKAWELARGLGPVRPAPKPPADEVVLFDGHIEILNAWFEWDVDRLIDEADVIHGIRFVRLEVILYSKKYLLGRPKDGDHIRILEDALLE